MLYVKGDLGNALDLDDFVTTGMWHQYSIAFARDGFNYSRTQAGLLTVVVRSSMVYQTYRVFSGAAGRNSDSIFILGRHNDVWSEWCRVLVEDAN